ncbi:hypothetical protein JCM3765_006347 [Sporobolomyces pararoseus]
MKGRADPTFLHPRIPALSVPCPCASPRLASILSTGGLSVIYLLWAIGLWYGYSAIEKLKAFVEVKSSAFDELRQMAIYALMSAWYFSTMALISFASFITSIFPQPELAKHLSRTIWVFGWMATWFVGIYGMAAHLSLDAWTVAGCNRDEACEAFRQRLQTWLFVALFVSLALVFWFAIVFSAFVHTLHPDIFHTGDVDSELDEYDHACLLEEELRHSDHPLAGEALQFLKAQREAGGHNMSNREGLRSRKAYRAQSGDSESESEGSDDEKAREALIGKERGSNPTTSRGRPSTKPILRPTSASSSNLGSSDLSSSEEESSAQEKEKKRAVKEESRKTASLSRSRSRSRSRSQSRSRSSRR